MRLNTPPETTTKELDQALNELRDAASRWVGTSVALRERLVVWLIERIGASASHWVEATCVAKQIPPNSPGRAEEIANGPMPTLRYLQLLHQTITALAERNELLLPGEGQTDSAGRVRVPVFPVRELFDQHAFRGFSAEVWLRPRENDEPLQEVPWFTPEQVNHEEEQELSPKERRIRQRKRAVSRQTKHQQPQSSGRVVLVLGAGNVSSIPVVDALTKIFEENKVVLLKMNPVNVYLGPLFEEALAPLFETNLLRIIYGGGEIGAKAVQDRRVDEVHITGSIHTHDRIVWGPPEEQSQRKAQHNPLLKKPITSELGNVTPWIVAPGKYSTRQLKFQAEGLVGSVVNNASFNCIATKVVVTWKDWPQRAKFLDLIDHYLAQVPPRAAYYPGAKERFARFGGEQLAEPEDNNEAPNLPWTFRRNLDPRADLQFFQEECFVCVFGEVALEAESEADFLRKAVEFCNEKLWGTLGAALTVPDSLTRSEEGQAQLDQAIADLNYGAVAVNHWVALAYALMALPWGSAPHSTLTDAQSGIGWVHNPFFFKGIEKSVLRGPLTMWPKPLWMPTHKRAERLAWNIIRLYTRPSIAKIPALAWNALRG